MIGLVIVTHGELAIELRRAAEHVVGPQKALATICIGPDDDMEKRRDDIREAVESVEQGRGVILLTDMFGGTPSNLAHGAMDAPDVEVIYGANLPMLVKLAKMRDRPLAEAVAEGIKAGRKYVNSANAILTTEPAS